MSRTENNEKNHDSELDSFWNIDSLLPAKKKQPERRQASTEAVEIKIDAPEPENDKKEQENIIKKYIPPHSADEKKNEDVPELEYCPRGGLIHKVRVFKWKMPYKYFERFCTDGEKLLGLHGRPCEPVSFFSYLPQYLQMNTAQLSWYLYWRDCVRAGNYPDTDFSYILLYVYELINITDPHKKASVPEAMCKLLLAYYREYNRLIMYMSEWICDYCLIHELPAPVGMLGPVYTDILSSCMLKEFYIGNTGNDKGEYISALLGFCTNYDYKKSKFYTDENKELYDKTIKGVLNASADALSGHDGIFSGGITQDTKVTRDTFIGALCSHRVKKRIEVQYCSFSRSHEMRFVVTDIIKYTENKIRAHIGIKSRLSVFNIPDKVKAVIDRYLDSALPISASVKPAQIQPEYEKQYDIPNTPISAEKARQIERNSWQTTQMLVDAFADDDQNTLEIPETIPDEAPEYAGDNEPETVGIQSDMLTGETSVCDEPANDSGTGKGTSTCIFGEYTEFVKLALSGDFQRQKVWSREHGMLTDAVADRINEIAADSDEVSDIILEETDHGYIVSADYTDIVVKLCEG